MLPATIAKRYTPIKVIHEGETGFVYQAVDHVFMRDVSLRIIDSAYTQDPSFPQEFGERVRAVADLSSPLIAKIYDWGFDEGTCYIAYQYIEGIDLSELMSLRGPMNTYHAIRIGAQVCQALAVAHADHIVHGSVRPNNIIVSRDAGATLVGFVKVYKARPIDENTKASARNRAYRPPEQARGEAPTEASDLFSLGVTIYELISGRRPYTSSEIRRMGLGGNPVEVPPLPDNPNIPCEDIYQVLRKALQPRPEDRYASAREMRDAFINCLKERAADRGDSSGVPIELNPGRRHDDPAEARAHAFRARPQGSHMAPPQKDGADERAGAVSWTRREDTYVPSHSWKPEDEERDMVSEGFPDASMDGTASKRNGWRDNLLMLAAAVILALIILVIVLLQ